MSEASAPARPRHPAVTAAITIGGFAALLWLIEIIDTITGSALQRGGVQPRELDGLIGILWAPVLHDDWGHLIANTGPLLVLGFVILLSGVRTWLGATAIIWVIGGFGTWLTGGPNTVHIGASVLVFGWVTFLILRGVFARNWLQITVGVLVLLGYGSILFGVFPGEQGISWQGHLFGAIGGVVAAVVFGRKAREQRTQRAVTR